MGLHINKSVLEQIWNYIKKSLVDEKTIIWLKKHRTFIWKDFKPYNNPSTEKTTWELNHVTTTIDISFRIQDVLDAKVDRQKPNYRYAKGLPKQYIIELTQLFGLNLKNSLNPSKQQLMDIILHKIKETKV